MVIEVTSEEGIPREIFTVNSTPFCSEDLSRDFRKQTIRYIISRSIYPQTNRYIEWCMMTLKTVIYKVMAADIPQNRALLKIQTRSFIPRLPNLAQIFHH